jgi:hypothetical protein
MSTLSKLPSLLFGAALVLLGLFTFFSGGISLPTRSPPSEFRFGGMPLFFLGLSPFVAGLLSLALAGGFVHRESRTTRWAIGVSFVALALAFLLAPTA